MILKIVVVIVVLVVAMLAYAAAKPDTFRVQRSIAVNAPPEKIFALINDFQKWDSWAPQDQQDPTMRRTYSGSMEGKGAVSEWSGSASTGKGRMAIIDSDPPKLVTIKVDFVKPFEAHNTNRFALEPAGGSTKVTWTIDASNLYTMKVMSIFVNIQKEFGKHMENGLSSLKAAAEK
jgi:carbon monoxide dehydrogenase subunit G